MPAPRRVSVQAQHPESTCHPPGHKPTGPGGGPAQGAPGWGLGTRLWWLCCQRGHITGTPELPFSTPQALCLGDNPLYLLVNTGCKHGTFAPRQVLIYLSARALPVTPRPGHSVTLCQTEGGPSETGRSLPGVHSRSAARPPAWVTCVVARACCRAALGLWGAPGGREAGCPLRPQREVFSRPARRLS